jgi:hypothetical protein
MKFPGEMVEQAPESQRIVKVKKPKRPKVAVPARGRDDTWGAYAASYPAYTGDRPF